jgi:hypothetical protein
MATCPACGIDSVEENGDCPECHLSASLFAAVRDAAGAEGDSDPTYLRTIGDLLATVEREDILPPATPVHGLLDRPSHFGALPAGIPGSPARTSPSIENVLDLPPMPTGSSELPDLKRRVGEYFEIGHRLGLDFTDFRSRADSAALVDHTDSLAILAREMFVYVSSTLAEGYEALLARRNELAPLVPTTSADIELVAVRRAIGIGDLAGAQRRLAHVRDALDTVEQEWEIGRILVTEGELMVATIRELGGDPGGATGPLEQGRRLFAEGHRAEAEQVLAHAAVALWTVLQPRLLADLHRLRDRMVEERSAGADIGPAVQELHAISVELRKRNFVGTIVSYRRLKFVVEGGTPGGVAPVGAGERSADLRFVPPA